MILAFSIAVAVLFGAGIRLMLAHDLVRIAAGTILISNAANLFLMSAGIGRGPAPILPADTSRISDPLVQALTLTSIVITFGFTALLFAIVHRIYRIWRTIDSSEIAKQEAEE